MSAGEGTRRPACSGRAAAGGRRRRSGPPPDRRRRGRAPRRRRRSFDHPAAAAGSRRAASPRRAPASSRAARLVRTGPCGSPPCGAGRRRPLARQPASPAPLPSANAVEAIRRRTRRRPRSPTLSGLVRTIGRPVGTARGGGGVAGKIAAGRLEFVGPRRGSRRRNSSGRAARRRGPGDRRQRCEGVAPEPGRDGFRSSRRPHPGRRGRRRCGPGSSPA